MRSATMTGLAIVVLVCCALSGPGVAAASDFWDTARHPGFAAHRKHVVQGLQALANHRPDLALPQADAAIARCPACEDGYVLRGQTLAALGRTGEALAAFERALTIRPDALDGSQAALDAAQCALNVGRPELGVAVLRRMLGQTHGRGAEHRALVMLADGLQAEGEAELRQALVAYREAAQYDDSQHQGLLGLALALHRSGATEEALALARRAGPDAGPASAGGWLPGPERAARLALWLTAIGDLPPAREAWLRAADGDGPWREHARATLRALGASPRDP